MIKKTDERRTTTLTAAYSTTIDGCVRKIAITSEGGFYLSYILTEETINDEQGAGRHAFSFFAALCGENGQTDSMLIRDVTGSYELAEELFKLISEGAVTPGTLLYVTEDFLASQ